MWSDSDTTRLADILRQKVLEIELHSYETKKTHAVDHESWSRFLEHTGIRSVDHPEQNDQAVVMPDPWWTPLGYKTWIVIPIEIAQKILVLGTI